jgi:pSer/pThr/pTyr-binding forkhead associated (FHA) protein
MARALGDSHAVPAPATLLALDWSGADSELLVGRHHSCDVRLTGASVSRRHAQLRFRDGHWILQDLDSMNGTRVNGVRVGRCELRPGDAVEVGELRLLVD